MKKQRTTKPRKNSLGVRSAEKTDRPVRDYKSGIKDSRNRSARRTPVSKTEKSAPSRTKDQGSRRRSSAVTVFERPQSENVRLNKFLADRGIASRRAAEQFILDGRVSINGKIVTELGVRVAPNDDVRVDNQRLERDAEHLVYYILYKPKNTITTAHDEKDRHTVFEYVRTKERVFPVGRLDRNTTGLLLFTNDGELARRLMHPSYKVSKVYRARTSRILHDDELEKLMRGVTIEEGDVTAPASVARNPQRPDEIAIELFEGKNRQIHRMIETLGAEVESLERIEYAGLTLRGLDRGTMRPLSPREVRALRRSVGMKDGTEV